MQKNYKKKKILGNLAQQLKWGIETVEESLNIFHCVCNHNVYSLVQIGKLKGKKQKYQKKAFC